MNADRLDDLDRRIVDTLQEAFPVCERPFLAVANQLRIRERELIERVDRLLRNGTLTRFGPLFNADRLGGAFMLGAMEVPPGSFDDIAATVNALPEVAHNYAREHRLNMWFVLATEDRDRIETTVEAIEKSTGLPVLCFPREREFCVRLKLAAQETAA